MFYSSHPTTEILSPAAKSLSHIWPPLPCSLINHTFPNLEKLPWVTSHMHTYISSVEIKEQKHFSFRHVFLIFFTNGTVRLEELLLKIITNLDTDKIKSAEFQLGIYLSIHFPLTKSQIEVLCLKFDLCLASANSTTNSNY